MRQYWFNSDNEGKPFSRDDYEHMVKSSKYLRDVIGFGSKRDFDEEGFLLIIACSQNWPKKKNTIEKQK